MSLSEELELARNYLAIERIRFGTRLGVVWEIVPGLEETEVPTLLLQPLVENAIKHGIAPNRGGGELRIFLRDEGERLCLGVANTGQPLTEDRAEGIGLRNLRERLALLGQSPDALQLRREEAWTVAELRLDVKVKP